MSLFDTIGQRTYKNLLADPKNSTKTALPMLPSQSKLEAGTVLCRNSAGFWLPATTSDLDGSVGVAILAEPVDTDADAGIAEDAAAYLTGTFIAGAVKLKSGTLTATHMLELRKQGIITESGEDAGDFDNALIAITYVANNGADPAETDYVAREIKGATHTVLANTVTGFTAPASKSFKKWNTKADGSGTDYAAAGTYTANADLKLYAVWGT